MGVVFFSLSQSYVVEIFLSFGRSKIIFLSTSFNTHIVKVFQVTEYPRKYAVSDLYQRIDRNVQDFIQLLQRGFFLFLSPDTRHCPPFS